MDTIQKQLAALWARIDIIKLLFDPEFPKVLASVIALLQRNMREPEGARRR